MHIVVVAINKVDAFVTSQVVERLLHRQAKFSSELRDENQCPFYFIGIAIHNITDLPCKGSTKFLLSENNMDLFTFFETLYQFLYPLLQPSSQFSDKDTH